jgi:aminoglycoside 3-N-acetyltransferase
MSSRDFIRSLVPSFLLEWNRRRKKEKVRKALEEKRASGQVWDIQSLVDSLRSAGIEQGKDLLVHSAMSRIGYVSGGPKTFVNALLEVLGPKANLLMPSSPVTTLQASHDLAKFDVMNTPSQMGAITEYFRANIAEARSAHPLEPVAVKGPDAQWYVKGHHTDGTAYGPSSPWQKHLDRGGQLLYVGTTLINSGTSLHAIEDIIGWKDFSFEVYLPQSKTYAVQLADGRNVNVITKVHNPDTSALRKCDGLISLLEEQGALKHVTIGEAPSLLVDGSKFKSVLLEQYHNNGVTMYTPEGR